MGTRLGYLLPLAFVWAAACAGRVAPGGQDTGQSAADGTSPPSHVLAYLPGRIQAITMDDVAFYFATSDSHDHAVYRLAKSGTESVQRLASATDPSRIAVDDERVYWTDLEDGEKGGTIFSVAKTGGAPAILANNQQRPLGIAVDGTNVYWANQGQDAAGEPFGGGQIVSLPKGGGTPVVQVDNLQLPDEIVLDQDGVIWHDLSTIRRVPKAGGPVTTLDSRKAGYNTVNLVVSAGQLYYWDGIANSLIRVPTSANDTAPPADGPFGTVLAQADYAGSIAVDGSDLLWSVFGGSSVAEITQIALSDGAQTVVVPPDSQSSPSGLMIDAADALLVDAHTMYSCEFWISRDGTSASVIRALPR